MKHHDDIFPYWGFGSRQGICRIRIYQTRLHTVVVASELRQNRGATVTSFIDGLATKVAQQYDLPTDRLVVIEVNDNPSIDAGVEDAYLGEDLYRRIMGEFLRRMERKRLGQRG